MQTADEIIITKEWHQLSAGEKDMIYDLAATEKEFNLLKKMLQVSAPDTDEVPLLSPAVSTAVKELLGEIQPAKTKWIPWLAAACVLGIIISLLLFTNKTPQQEIVKLDEPDNLKPVLSDRDTARVKDSLLVIRQVPAKRQPAHPIVSPIMPTPLNQLTVVDSTSFAAVSVAGHTELLDLITEAE